MQQHAAELNATLEAIADGVNIYDRDGRILHLNDAARRLTGLSLEYQDQSIEQRMQQRSSTHPDGTPYQVEETPPYRALLLNEAVSGEIMVLHFPDHTNWVSVSAAPIYMPDGQKLGAIATMTDITSLHELQERERRYLYMLAHNLRAPATLIKGNLELLLDKLQASELMVPYRRIVESLQRALFRMSTMIDDFHLVTRLEEGTITTHPTPVALPIFLHDFLPLLASDAGEQPDTSRPSCRTAAGAD